MFDLIHSIAAGFGGKLKDSPEARKLIWLLIVALFFSCCCIFFIAYVSYTRYRAISGFLPGADVVAFSFTTGIALFMYYVSSHVSAFAVESWLYGKSRLAWQGVIIFAVAGILVGVIDYRMNLDGAEDVAEQSAGVVAQVDEGEIMERYQTEIDRLEGRKKAVLQKYWWKGKLYFEPYPVTRHPRGVWAQDTAKVNRLDRQIAAAEDLKAQALSDARNAFQLKRKRRDGRRETTHKRLKVAVQGVYFLQFLLTLVTAFILLKMDEALSGGVSVAGSSGAIGFGGGVAAPSSRERNEIRALKEEVENLKSQMAAPPEAQPEDVPIESGDTGGVNIHTHSTGYLISCAHCGKEAVKKSPRARFCSRRCRISSWNGKHPGREIQIVPNDKNGEKR